MGSGGRGIQEPQQWTGGAIQHDTGSPGGRGQAPGPWSGGPIHGIQGADQVSAPGDQATPEQVRGLGGDGAPEVGGAEDHDLVQPPSSGDSRGREAGDAGQNQVRCGQTIKLLQPAGPELHRQAIPAHLT